MGLGNIANTSGRCLEAASSRIRSFWFIKSPVYFIIVLMKKLWYFPQPALSIPALAMRDAFVGKYLTTIFLRWSLYVSSEYCISKFPTLLARLLQSFPYAFTNTSSREGPCSLLKLSEWWRKRLTKVFLLHHKQSLLIAIQMFSSNLITWEPSRVG